MGLRPTNNEAAGPKIGRSPSVFSAFFTFSCFFPSVNATAGICELASGDSDSTIIFTIAPELSGGSKATADFAAAHQKPWLHISQDHDADTSVEKLKRFLADHDPKTLNVAGSRQSEEPSIRNFVQEVLSKLIYEPPVAY